MLFLFTLYKKCRLGPKLKKVLLRLSHRSWDLYSSYLKKAVVCRPSPKDTRPFHYPGDYISDSEDPELPFIPLKRKKRLRRKPLNPILTNLPVMREIIPFFPNWDLEEYLRFLRVPSVRTWMSVWTSSFSPFRHVVVEMDIVADIKQELKALHPTIPWDDSSINALRHFPGLINHVETNRVTPVAEDDDIASALQFARAFGRF
jgi:hypothetical protein